MTPAARAAMSRWCNTVGNNTVSRLKRKTLFQEVNYRTTSNPGTPFDSSRALAVVVKSSLFCLTRIRYEAGGKREYFSRLLERSNQRRKRPFQFDKRRKQFISLHEVARSIVAVRVHDPHKPAGVKADTQPIDQPSCRSQSAIISQYFMA